MKVTAPSRHPSGIGEFLELERIGTPGFKIVNNSWSNHPLTIRREMSEVGGKLRFSTQLSYKMVNTPSAKAEGFSRLRGLLPVATPNV